MLAVASGAARSSGRSACERRNGARRLTAIRRSNCSVVLDKGTDKLFVDKCSAPIFNISNRRIDTSVVHETISISVFAAKLQVQMYKYCTNNNQPSCPAFLSPPASTNRTRNIPPHQTARPLTVAHQYRSRAIALDGRLARFLRARSTCVAWRH